MTLGKRSSEDWRKAGWLGDGLSAEHVTVRYGDDVVLADVSLHVRPGDHVALTGENGSGKSTLLGLLAGRGFRGRPPHGGTVYVDGLSMYDQRESVRTSWRSGPIAFLSQRPKLGLLADLSVAENLRLVAALTGEPVAEARLDAALTHYSLTGLLNRRLGDLSGGQQQLVALARLEASDPKLLLLDEPCAALSPSMSSLVGERLTSLATSGNAVVSVSHELTPAAPRIVHLQSGRLQLTADEPL